MIDWSRVNELRDELGDEDFDEIVDLFLDEVQEGLASLSPNMGAPEMEDAMHSLKGSALNLGFTEFAHLCQSGETAAANGDTSTIDIAKTKQLFHATVDLFQQSNQGAAA